MEDSGAMVLVVGGGGGSIWPLRRRGLVLLAGYTSADAAGQVFAFGPGATG